MVPRSKHLKDLYPQSTRGSRLGHGIWEGRTLASDRAGRRLAWEAHLLHAASGSAATRAIWSRFPQTLGPTVPRSLSRWCGEAACQVASEHQRQSTCTQLRTQMSMASSSGNKSDLLRTVSLVEWALPDASFVGLEHFSIRHIPPWRHRSFSLTTEASIHAVNPSTSISPTSSISSPHLRNHLVAAAK